MCSLSTERVLFGASTVCTYTLSIECVLFLQNVFSSYRICSLWRIYCVYIHMCMHVHMYVCVYACVVNQVAAHLRTRMAHLMYVCMFACMYAYTHVCMYVCMCTCVNQAAARPRTRMAHLIRGEPRLPPFVPSDSYAGPREGYLPFTVEYVLLLMVREHSMYGKRTFSVHTHAHTHTHSTNARLRLPASLRFQSGRSRAHSLEGQEE